MTMRLALIAVASLALAGCSGDDAPKGQAAADPVMVAALHAPLLVDPDLSQFNARNLAIVPPGPALPPQPVPSGTYNEP